jgi:ferric-dicitrate binding protein FerR (iron transport regulator)
MSRARFAAIVDAYGGDSQRWPEVERDAAQRWLAANPEAEALVAQARGLDQAMARPESVAVSAALENRLLMDFDRMARGWSWHKLARAAAETVWPGAPVWQPACALGLSLAIGICVAVFAPLDVAPPSDAAGSGFALDATPDADAGQGI